MDGNEAKEVKPSLSETCVKHAVGLLERAAAGGTDAGQFACAGADLFATAQRSEGHFGPKQFSELLASCLPMLAIISGIGNRPAQAAPAVDNGLHIEPGPWEKRAARIRELEQVKDAHGLGELDELRELKAAQDADQKTMQVRGIAHYVVHQHQEKVIKDLTDRLFDLSRENRNGSTDGEIEKLLTQTIPIECERIERMRFLVESHDFTVCGEVQS